MKTITECMFFINSFDRYKNGDFKKLMDNLDNPQKDLNFIHIGGTNGKGSTAAMVQAVLSSFGKKTGLYSSPFIMDFKERIQIDGRCISEKELIYCANIVKIAVKQMCCTDDILLSNFDIITAISFIFYKKMACDVIVLEVGLGGRLDATNIIENPLITAITSISMDHMNILGDNILDICIEKCGIIKNNSTLVLNPIQEKKVFKYITKYCKDKNTNIIIPKLEKLEILEINESGSIFEYKKQKYIINLIGKHQIYNAITAIEILKNLDIIANKNIVFPAIKIMGRMEKIKNNLFVDGSHNIGGIETLCENIKILFPEKLIYTIMAISNKKDFALCKQTMLDNSDYFSFICHEDYSETEIYHKIKAELDFAFKFSDENTVIIVCGSLYNISYIKKYFTPKKRQNNHYS